MGVESIINAIKKAKTVAIISHVNPDGDTVGSALALYKAIKMYGASPYIFCEDAPKGKVATLSGADKYNVDSLPAYDLAIAVDCADRERMGDAYNEFVKGRHTADIDHHKTNRGYGEYNYIDINAAATAQIMYNVVRGIVNINDEIARLLYTGLVTDSGGFTFSNVTPDTMKVAAELLRYDIKAHEICEFFLKKIRRQVFELKNRVLSKAKFYDDGAIGIISFRQDDFDATDTDISCTEGIINNILNVLGVRVAVAISEVKERDYKISVRTGEDVDSSHIVYIFGGGGHKNAAGCRISGYYENVVDKVLKAVRDEL